MVHVLSFQVPYELLNKKFRSAQKTVDREVSKAQSAGSDLEACLQNKEVTIGEVTKVLDNMVEKLKFLKRKVLRPRIYLKGFKLPFKTGDQEVAGSTLAEVGNVLS